MQSKRLILAIALSFLALMVWQKISMRLWPQPARPTATSTAPSTTTTSAPATTVERPTVSVGQVGSVREQAVRRDNIRLGDSTRNNGYEILAVLSNRGAAMRTVQLANYAQTVHQPDTGYQLFAPVDYANGTRLSMASEKLVVFVNDTEKLEVDLESVNWFVKTNQSDKQEQVTFSIPISYKDKDLLELSKTYTLGRETFDLQMTTAIKNVSDVPVSVVLCQRGPLGLPKEASRGDQRKSFAGFRTSGDEGVVSKSVNRGALIKTDELAKPLVGAKDRAVWAGQVNKYFAALLTVLGDGAARIAEVKAACYSDDAEQGDDLTTVWITKPIPIDGSGSVSLDFEMYLGPKSDTIFNNNATYTSRNYQGVIEYSMCTLQWLAEIMAKLLKALHVVTKNYGLAIILMVLLVRGLMHPITKRSQVSMMRMQQDMKRLQPKMQAIKEKYKNNREAQNKAIMELYKQEGVNPAGQMLGCLPMMFQLPIWVALWTALNNTFELRHQPFVLWIKDLAGPDSLIVFDQSFKIPLLSGIMGPIGQLNLLPILLGASMLVQHLLTPQPSAAADSDQAKQQKFMMYFMALFFPLLLYNAPSGLNLYIMTSTLFGVIENRRVRKHIAEEQAKGTVQKPKKARKSRWEQWSKKLERMAKEVEDKKKPKGRK